MEKTDAFHWLISDRSTFQIFCSRSLRQYRINYKFHMSVRLLTIKISQRAHEDSAVIVKSLIAKHRSFAVIIRTCPVPVQLKPSLYKLFQFLLKDFHDFSAVSSRK